MDPYFKFLSFFFFFFSLLFCEKERIFTEMFLGERMRVWSIEQWHIKISMMSQKLCHEDILLLMNCKNHLGTILMIQRPLYGWYRCFFCY